METGIRLLLWAVVTSLPFSPCLCGEEFPICAIPCCTVQPSCSEALRVTCDCPDRTTVSLKKSGVSTSVKVIEILRAKSVIIYEDAISSLTSLENLSLREIDEVDIGKGGLTLQKQSYLRLIRIEDIGTIHVKGEAFSGAWQNDTSIEFRGVAKMHIESNAFQYVSEWLGPSVMFHNVGKLELASEAFNSPITQLFLNNVAMGICQSESFGKNSQVTRMNNVTIAHAKANCVAGLGGRTILSIQSSRIEAVYPHAFSGHMHQVTIRNSDFLIMHEKGVHIRVKKMEMDGLYVKNLSSHGINVWADESLHMKNIKIISLKKNGLAGLQISPSPTGFCPPLEINRLGVVETEPGSLTFAECTDLVMTDLMVEAPSSQICPTEAWIRTLSEGSDSVSLSRVQYELFFQLIASSFCNDDNMKLSPPAPFDSEHCALVRRHKSNDFHSVKEEVVEHLVGSGTGEDVSSLVTGKSDHEVSTNKYNTSVEALPAASLLQGNAKPDPRPTTQSPPPTIVPDAADDNVAAPVDDQSATPSYALSALAAEQHRLMLYLSLGAVLSLAVVLAAALLLLLLLTRRRRRRRSVEETPQHVETILMVMANRLLHSGCGGDSGDQSGRSRTVSDSATSGFGSARPSVDAHQYEPIREELLLPAAPPTPPLIRLDEDSYGEEQTYERLLDR